MAGSVVNTDRGSGGRRGPSGGTRCGLSRDDPRCARRRKKDYAAESGAETLVAQAAALDGQAVAEQAVA